MYIVGEREIRLLVIIRFLKNSLNLFQKIWHFCNTFRYLLQRALLDIIVEQTNIYSFQTIHKSIDTNCTEIMPLIGMSIKMEIFQLPSYKSCCSWELRFPRIADVMPRNSYQNLLRYLHFVNNDSVTTQEKLAQTRPLISMVWEALVKTEPEEYKSVHKLIIASKA